MFCDVSINYCFNFFSKRELYGNKIGGKIPKELGKLKELVSLDLYDNQFHGVIPRSLGKLKSLKFL